MLNDSVSDQLLLLVAGLPFHVNSYVAPADESNTPTHQPSGLPFHPLSKAQIIAELWSISWYIHYVWISRTNSTRASWHDLSLSSS